MKAKPFIKWHLGQGGILGDDVEAIVFPTHRRRCGRRAGPMRSAPCAPASLRKAGTCTASAGEICGLPRLNGYTSRHQKCPE